MIGHGYASVSLEGFAGFNLLLSAAPWSSIAIPDTLITDSLPAGASDGLGIHAQWKLRLARAVHTAMVVQSNNQTLSDVDAVWDNAQRRLDLAVTLAEASPDPAVRDAGARLRAALLPVPATGRSPTQLPVSQEVYYGTAQHDRAQQPEIHAAAVTAGVVAILGEIHTATQLLAVASGVTPGSTRTLTAKAESHAARLLCVGTFNTVHADVEWYLANSADGPSRTTALALEATLNDLLAHFPPRVRATGATATAGTAPAGTAPVGTAPVGTAPAGTAPAATAHGVPAAPAVQSQGPAVPSAPVGIGTPPVTGVSPGATVVGTPATGGPAAPAGHENVAQGPAGAQPTTVTPTPATAPRARARRTATQASTRAGVKTGKKTGAKTVRKVTVKAGAAARPAPRQAAVRKTRAKGG